MVLDLCDTRCPDSFYISLPNRCLTVYCDAILVDTQISTEFPVSTYLLICYYRIIKSIFYHLLTVYHESQLSANHN